MKTGTNNDELFGTEETEDVLDLIDAGAQVYNVAKADGKIDLQDLPLIFGVIPKISQAFVGVEKVPEELADLSDEEIAKLNLKYGPRIRDRNYRRAINGFAYFSNAVKDIVLEGKEETEVVA